LYTVDLPLAVVHQEPADHTRRDACLKLVSNLEAFLAD
jgi:hypothetical protein